MLLVSKSSEGLKRALRILNTFCDKWKLQVNTDKTKIVIFNPKKASFYGPFVYSGQIVDIVKEYTYLGLKIDQNMNFKSAVKELVLKASRAYAAIYQNINIYEGARPRTVLKIFDTMIIPICTYDSEVWGSLYL